MKASDITPKVIELSKEIAEHWRMEIYEGCWIYSEVTATLLLTSNDHLGIMLEAQEKNVPGYIPIPSISDCLEKLRESLSKSHVVYKNPSDLPYHYTPKRETKLRPGIISRLVFEFLIGKLSLQELHEALLSVLLEVLKGVANERICE